MCLSQFPFHLGSINTPFELQSGKVPSGKRTYARRVFLKWQRWHFRPRNGVCYAKLALISLCSFAGEEDIFQKKVFLAEASVIVWESKRGAVDKQKVKKEFYALLGATKNCVNCLLFFFFYPILSFPFKMRKHVFPPLPLR